VLDGCVVPMEEMAGSQGQSRQSHVH
jgi:hypothetical protein